MRDSFSSRSDLYAKYRPLYPAELYKWLLSHVKEKKYAWDCGTGNAQVAAELSKYFEKVFASDISEQQLAEAIKRTNIEYSVQPAESSNFSNSQFDLITVAQAIHWFDFEKFYNEVRRTLKPDGTVAIIGYGLIKINPVLDAIIQHFYENIVGRYWDAERRYIDELYTTIPFPFKERAAPVFAIVDDWTFDHLLGYFSTWSAVKNYIKHRNEDPIPLISDKLRSAWGNERLIKISFSILLRVGTLA